MVTIILLTVLVPRPVTYADTCPASSNVGWLGDATGGYWWDPFAVAMQPLICLLTAVYLYATMRTKTDSERGVLSWYLAAFSGWSPYCLAVYLWQLPFSHFFTAGAGVIDVMVPMMFFALFVWSALYTELVEKPAVQLLRWAFGSCGALFASEAFPAEDSKQQKLVSP